MITKVELDNKVAATRLSAVEVLTRGSYPPAEIVAALSSKLTLANAISLSRLDYQDYDLDNKIVIREILNTIDTDSLIAMLEGVNTVYYERDNKGDDRELEGKMMGLDWGFINDVTMVLNARSDKFVYLADDDCKIETNLLTVNNVGRSYRSYWESESTVLSEGAL